MIINWNEFYSLNYYKRLLMDQSINSYILITDRVINEKYKRLSILNRLFTDKERYLVPAEIYKQKLFISTSIFNWINIDDNWYRICSKGSIKDYILDFNEQQLIHISNITNKKLLKIINRYYKNHNNETDTINNCI